MKVVLFSLVMISAAALADYPQPNGLWLFDDPDHLTQSVVGSELVEAGTHTAVAGTSAGDGAVADGIGSYYICSHSIAPNGGGSYVNSWTSSSRPPARGTGSPYTRPIPPMPMTGIVLSPPAERSEWARPDIPPG
jgi:hypothetical protein